jgi:phosphohistidine phosphatase
VTTRTLVIVRHAKAADPEATADRDRPLTARGHADAAAAGAWLNRRGYEPDLVLCSPARRTRETWHGIAVALAAGPEVRYADEIYGGDTSSLLELVHGAADTVGVVALIGHNPTVSQLCAHLDPARADPDGLRTSGIAVFAVEGSWRDYAPGAAEIVATHTARA